MKKSFALRVVFKTRDVGIARSEHGRVLGSVQNGYLESQPIVGSLVLLSPLLPVVFSLAVLPF
jgi:hypothetical protein